MTDPTTGPTTSPATAATTPDELWRLDGIGPATADVPEPASLAGPAGLAGPPPGTFDDPDPETAQALRDAQQARRDADDLDREIRWQKLRKQAQRVVVADEHASSWKRPVEYGTLADELELPDEPVTYRVADVIPVGANTVLTAQYKTGKTTMVNHLVKCLADGDPFLGKYPVTPLDGRIGVFNYEVGEAQYRRWMRNLGIANPDRVALLHLRGKRLPLSVPEIEEYVTDWLKRHEVQFWTLDPYARALIGSAEENDNSGVGAFLDTLDVIKANAGVSELFMPAHTGRYEQTPGDERARGATRIDDWPDVRWLLTHEKDTGRRFLKCTGRDVEEPEQALAYDVETRGLAVVGGSRAVIRRVGLEEELLRLIGATPGLGTNELFAAFPHKRNDVSATLRAMESRRLIRIDYGPNRKKFHFLTGGTGGTRPGQEGFETQPLPWAVSDPSVGIT